MYDKEWHDSVDIPGYEGKYRINPSGDVFSLRPNGSVKKLKVTINKSTGYKKVNLMWSTKCKPRKTFNLHRLLYISFIENVGAEFHVDHINGDKQDNRLSNLRKATPSQNRVNSKKRQNSHKYRGYTFNKNGKFYVMVGSDHVGTAVSPVQAAVLYDLEAIKRYGIYARTNLIHIADNLFKKGLVC